MLSRAGWLGKRGAVRRGARPQELPRFTEPVAEPQLLALPVLPNLVPGPRPGVALPG